MVDLATGEIAIRLVVGGPVPVIGITGARGPASISHGAEEPDHAPGASVGVQFDNDSHLVENGCHEQKTLDPVSYTHLRAHETDSYLVCRLLLEKKKTE